MRESKLMAPEFRSNKRGLNWLGQKDGAHWGKCRWKLEGQ